MKVNLFRRGTTWWVDYRVDGRRVRESLGVSNRKIAHERRIELEFRLLRGPTAVAVVEPAPEPGVPIAELRDRYDDWSKAHKRPRTHKNDLKRLDRFLDDLDVDDTCAVTAGHGMDFLAKVAIEGAAPATVLRYREVMHAFFQFAVRRGVLERNPIAAVPRPRLPDRDIRFLSQDQIDEVLKAVGGDRIAPLIATAVFAGLRREELCWLTRDDLELQSDPPVLRVRAKTVDGQSWMPKTKRDRVIPVSTRLLEVLARVPEKRSPWLFPSPGGCRWDPDNLSRCVRKFMRRAGQPWGFLDFRHTFGSQLARKGVSLLKIATLMGNSPDIARKHYIRLVPEELSADVEF